MKEEWKPSAPGGCWSLHVLQGGEVKYSSDGRIIIGSSWWRVFRWWGVPLSLHLIPSLLSHLVSFLTPAFFLILCLLYAFIISWLPCRVLETFWTFKDTLATTLYWTLLMGAKAKLKCQLTGIRWFLDETSRFCVFMFTNAKLHFEEHRNPLDQWNVFQALLSCLQT